MKTAHRRTNLSRRLLSSLAVATMLAMAVGTATAAAQEPDPGGAGVGAFPASININDGYRGTQIDRQLGLINSDNAPRIFELHPAGDVGPWITFLDADGLVTMTEVEVPANTTLRLTLRLDVPEATPNGSYLGGVRAVALPVGESDGSRQAVRMGIDIGLRVQIVGDQVIAGEYLDLEVLSTEVGLPARIEATLRNDGNVVALPDLHYVVSYDGDPTAEFDGAREVIDISSTETVSYGWETDQERPGDYTVEVSVVWPGLDLGTRTATFSLAPRGTMTRDADFTSLELVNEPEPGDLAQLRASFQNTGAIEARVQFVGRLEFEGELIGVVETPLKLVMPGDFDSIDIFVDVEELGRYVLLGALNYEGQETDERAVTFDVPTDPPPSPIMILSVAGLLVLATAGLVGSAARRLRRVRRQATDEAAGRERQLVGVGDRQRRSP